MTRESKLKPLTKNLLRSAASFTAQFLWVWVTQAQRGWDPYGDDKLKLTGAFATIEGNAGLNKGEARNALARAVFFHRLGQIRDDGKTGHGPARFWPRLC